MKQVPFWYIHHVIKPNTYMPNIITGLAHISISHSKPQTLTLHIWDMGAHLFYFFGSHKNSINIMTCISKSMASTSHSSQVKTSRNLLDLPPELTSLILMRVGSIDLLKSAWKVCKIWRIICYDPAIWRVVDISIKWIIITITKEHSMKLDWRRWLGKPSTWAMDKWMILLYTMLCQMFCLAMFPIGIIYIPSKLFILILYDEMNVLISVNFSLDSHLLV